MWPLVSSPSSAPEGATRIAVLHLLLRRMCTMKRFTQTLYRCSPAQPTSLLTKYNKFLLQTSSSCHIYTLETQQSNNIYTELINHSYHSFVTIINSTINNSHVNIPRDRVWERHHAQSSKDAVPFTCSYSVLSHARPVDHCS